VSWGNPETTLERLQAGALLPVSALYELALRCRARSYELGWLRVFRAGVPVVSVGNITVGGTGKTPVVIDLARRFRQDGYMVGILSRGWARHSAGGSLVVADGHGEVASCLEAGDEPHMMAHAVKDAVVVVGSRRAQCAAVAIEFGCNLLLLDDGFQHRALARALDIVLIDYNDSPDRDMVLPAGRLREPLAALARADWVVITKVPSEPDEQKLAALQELFARYCPQAQVSSCRIVSRLLQVHGSDAEKEATFLAGKRVAAFAGIARPDQFWRCLRELDADVALARSFGDHHWYTAGNLERLRRDGLACGAAYFVTTEKDAVKLSGESTNDMQLLVLKQQVEWLGPVPTIQGR
jgi:tetraacyldisaccharide 4'-kinase